MIADIGTENKDYNIFASLDIFRI